MIMIPNNIKDLAPKSQSATAQVTSPAPDSDSEDITEAMTRMDIPIRLRRVWV